MELVVIADDLTGANACGALFAETGFRVETKFHWSEHSLNSSVDVTMVDTNSRQSSPVVARSKLQEMIHTYRANEISYFANRIDSTMRGNVGAEAAEWLLQFGEQSIVVIVPSFPDSGRTVRDGLLYVHGQLMHQTSVGDDPTTPIKDSSISSIIHAQTVEATAHVQLQEVEKGAESLANQFRKLPEKEQRIVIVDAVTNEHITTIAKAMTLCNLPMYPFDPGPLTYHFMKSKLLMNIEKPPKQMVCIGSANQLIEAQMNKFCNDRKLEPIVVNPKWFLEPCEYEFISEQAQRIHRLLITQDIVVTTTIVPGERRLSLQEYAEQHQQSVEHISQRITSGFAMFAYKLLSENPSIRGCFTSGGDFTAALCKISGADGLRLQQQIAPLTALAQLTGGDLDGLRVITKGGSVGELDVIDTCVRRLEVEANKEEDMEVIE
ncbi:four-carbon acid sugar kinase family protein [Geomicrobium sp. JSM 1781026]|uniref:four-carbon acid sugar kinase family protein n=1 Tax=Geomicrobium sp. JSM 1781026 TaxID=3344580 RepID=UPI0035C17C06